MKDTPEYLLVKRFYRNRRARRSKVLLIRHIDEGLRILQHIKASEQAQRAYCLHPIVQADVDLYQNLKFLNGMDPIVVAIAMEYRRVANACLSTRTLHDWTEIELSPLKDVNDMLVADKVQNCRDFERYHYGTHRRSKELKQYFEHWHARLGITPKLREQLDRLESGEPSYNCTTPEDFHGDAG